VGCGKNPHQMNFLFDLVPQHDGKTVDVYSPEPDGRIVTKALWERGQRQLCRRRLEYELLGDISIGCPEIPICDFGDLGRRRRHHAHGLGNHRPMRDIIMS
jgi:hypothetical protein